MTNVQLTIRTAVHGGSDNFSSVGTMERKGEDFLIAYPVGGDSALLRSDGDSLVMERSGDLSLAVRFSPGERTEMTTSCAGCSGTLPVFTTLLSVSPNRLGLFIRLSYYLMSVPDPSYFDLSITVTTLFSEDK